LWYNEVGDKMYKIKGIDKSLLIVGIVFVVISLVVAAILSFIFVFNTYFYDSKADVVLINWSYDQKDDEYSPELVYEFNNKIYYCKPNYSSSSKTDFKRVYFNESDPSSCTIDFKTSPIIYLIFIVPGVFILFGSIMIIIYICKYKNINKLKNHGILVKNIDCELSKTSVFVNGVQMYKIKAIYTFPDGVSRILERKIKSSECDIDNHQCDLIYLMNNYNVYYLDFDIEYENLH